MLSVRCPAHTIYEIFLVDAVSRTLDVLSAETSHFRTVQSAHPQFYCGNRLSITGPRNDVVKIELPCQPVPLTREYQLIGACPTRQVNGMVARRRFARRNFELEDMHWPFFRLLIRMPCRRNCTPVRTEAKERSQIILI